MTLIFWQMEGHLEMDDGRTIAFKLVRGSISTWSQLAPAGSELDTAQPQLFLFYFHTTSSFMTLKICILCWFLQAKLFSSIFALPSLLFKLCSSSFALQALLFKLYSSSFVIQALLFKFRSSSFALQAMVFNVRFSCYLSSIIFFKPGTRLSNLQSSPILNSIAIIHLFVWPKLTVPTVLWFVKHISEKHYGRTYTRTKPLLELLVAAKNDWIITILCVVLSLCCVLWVKLILHAGKKEEIFVWSWTYKEQGHP